ncbi:hypothetical protein Fmac_014289 [Flemingia macrophylla]|uniref:Uncharacterized protein n=1 Tax=Flemingia macrophylla TaxID=520843 RepID=A0ABD1MBD1_9FABA
MGDDHMKSTFRAKPKQELEELYRGIPDESVDLTFQDLANVNSSSHNINTNTTIDTHVEHFSEASNPTKVLSTLPSLDFRKGLEALNHTHHQHDTNYNHHHHQGFGGDSPMSQWGRFSHASVGAPSAQHRAGEYSMSYDAMKSGESLAPGKGGYGRRRRPGIPHSKICTICSNYVYFFRTRCLVCGRVYCRQCVEVGMGDMTEGRKCIECLGLRFSQRYLERAGMIGFCSWRYPSTLKHVELKWAEKGPRRSGHHGMTSTRLRTPRGPHSIAYTEPSFVMSETRSPISAHHHHLPL